MNRNLAAALVAAAAVGLPTQLRAETQNCTNLTSLPAVIGSQGVYCLKQDLATSITSGTAIQIAANNVTLDCNGFKLGGLGAGTGTQARGIASSPSSNVTIRNCNIRGFHTAVNLGFSTAPDASASGNIVEHNRIESSRLRGITVSGDASVVRGNMISGTGLNTLDFPPAAIEANMGVDIVDNTIDGVAPTPGSLSQVAGIVTWNNSGGTVSNNRIRNLRSADTAFGVVNLSTSANMLIRENVVSARPDTNTMPITCDQPHSLAVGNVALGVATVVQGCADGGGNVSNLTP